MSTRKNKKINKKLGQDELSSLQNISAQIENKKLIKKINNTKAYYPKNKTIHEVFEAQAKTTPGAEAISEAGETLTYQQLNVQMLFDDAGYCLYCFDEEKNYDEDEIDCNYGIGKSCPVCKQEVASYRGVLYVFSWPLFFGFISLL